MNKQLVVRKKKSKAISSVAAAYVVQGGVSKRSVRVDSGIDVIVPEVAGSNSNFLAVGYSLNPGLESSFASLSQEAKRYDCYEFEELSFHFIGTTVISTTVGQVGLAFEPNPNSQPPDSQAKFSAYECHTSSSVYKPDGLKLSVPRHMLTGRRFVRSTTIGSNLAIYDPGFLVVMVRNEASTAVIGYVEAKYKVRFFDFHLEPSLTLVSRKTAVWYKLANQTITTATLTTLAFDAKKHGLESEATAGVISLYPGIYDINASIVFKDTVAEYFSAIVYLKQVVGGVTSTITTVNATCEVSTTGYLTLALTDVIRSSVDCDVYLACALTGAAGTLTMEALGSRFAIVAL